RTSGNGSRKESIGAIKSHKIQIIYRGSAQQQKIVVKDCMHQIPRRAGVECETINDFLPHAATHHFAPFEKVHLIPGASQQGGTSQSGYPTADDRHAFHRRPPVITARDMSTSFTVLGTRMRWR